MDQHANQKSDLKNAISSKVKLKFQRVKYRKSFYRSMLRNVAELAVNIQALTFKIDYIIITLQKQKPLSELTGALSSPSSVPSFCAEDGVTLKHDAMNLQNSTCDTE